MTRAAVGKVQLEYRASGPPSGEPILLLMGSATPLVQWEDSFVRALAQAGHLVVAFDYRDTGRSSYIDVPVPDSTSEMTSALAAGQCIGRSSKYSAPSAQRVLSTES